MKIEHVFCKLHVDCYFVLALVVGDGEAIGDLNVIASFLHRTQKSADGAASIFRPSLVGIDDAEQHRRMYDHVGNQTHIFRIMTVLIVELFYTPQTDDG